jgi:hypothetical protein
VPQNTDLNLSNSETQAIAYKNRLNSWAIARLVQGKQNEIVGRFRRRSDADGHMQLMCRMTPEANFMLVFERQQNEAAV